MSEFEGSPCTSARCEEFDMVFYIKTVGGIVLATDKEVMSEISSSNVIGSCVVLQGESCNQS